MCVTLASAALANTASLCGASEGLLFVDDGRWCVAEAGFASDAASIERDFSELGNL